MSSDADVVIRARHLAKAYRLYGSEREWLKQVLVGSYKTYYKSFWALKDISFEVRRGEGFGVIGRNGCGKSTLLQIVCGMTRPTKGEIWVNGRVAPVLALGATFDLEATGRENVMIGGAVLGLKRKDIMRKFESIVDFAGIGDFMEQPIKLYSSGMRLRLAFAISVHADAEILIVDEALSVGDAAFQKKCIDWIDKFRQTGTLLFVSHSPGEVARLCQNSIWIDDGRVRAQGNSTDIVKAYNRAVRTEEDTMKRFSVTA
jgi:lipopolysaccharide transport system ATP-binding protein